MEVAKETKQIPVDAGSSSEDGNEVHPLPPREDLTDVDEASEDLEDYDFVTLNYISKGTDPFEVSSNELKTSTINVLTTLDVLEDNYSTFQTKEVLDDIGNLTLIQNETSVKLEDNIAIATLLVDENSPTTINSDQDNQIVFNKNTSSANSEDDELTTSVVTEEFTRPDLISDNTTSFSQYFDETLLTELEELTDSTAAKTETPTLQSGTTETTAETEWFEDYLY